MGISVEGLEELVINSGKTQLRKRLTYVVIVSFPVLNISILANFGTKQRRLHLNERMEGGMNVQCQKVQTFLLTESLHALSQTLSTQTFNAQSPIFATILTVLSIGGLQLAP